jgi:hypothetical protein
MLFDSRQASTLRLALLSLSKGHDGDQIEEAPAHGQIGHIRAPDVVGARDFQIARQIGINPMLGMRIACARTLVNCRQPHHRHQPPDRATADRMAQTPQMPRHLTAAAPPTSHERLVDHRHQRQPLLGLRYPRAVIG